MPSWLTEVVFSGRKTIFTCDMLSVIGCSRQLSIINWSFLSLAWNFLFKSFTHSSNKVLSIQHFLCDWYPQISFQMFLKHLGFFTLPYNKHLVFIANGIRGCQTSDSYFAVFTTWTFFRFQLIGFVW